MKKLLLIFTFFHVIFFFSCEEVVVDNSDKYSTLELNLTINENSVELNWSEVNHSEFEEYILVRSSKPIPDDISALDNDAIILSEIKELETTSYDDFSYTFNDSMYFKVFANIGSRSIPSKLISMTSSDRTLNMKELSHGFNHATFSPTNQSIFYASTVNDGLWKYDLNSSQETRVRDLDAYYSHLAVFPHNGKDELYVMDNQTNDVYIHDAENLSLKRTYNNSRDCKGLAKNHNNLIMMAIRDETTPITIFSRVANHLEDYSYTEYYYDRAIGLLSDTENLFLEVSVREIHTYKLNNDGTLIEHKKVDIEDSSNPNPLAISPDKEYFLSYREGKIFNKNLEIIGELNEISNANYSSYSFSQDSKLLFATSMNDNSLEVYDVPTFNLKKKIRLGYRPMHVFENNDEIIILGAYFDFIDGNSINKYFVHHISISNFN